MRTSTITITYRLTVTHPNTTETATLKELTAEMLRADFYFPTETKVTIQTADKQDDCAVSPVIKPIIGYEITDAEDYLYRELIPGQMFRNPHNALLYMARKGLLGKYRLRPVREEERSTPDFLD